MFRKIYWFFFAGVVMSSILAMWRAESVGLGELIGVYFILNLVIGSGAYIFREHETTHKGFMVIFLLTAIYFAVFLGISWKLIIYEYGWIAVLMLAPPFYWYARFNGLFSKK